MNKELFIKTVITINADASKVWDALTNPEMTKKYMFGCEAISDWKVGSPLLWNGIAEGKTVTYVKGNIVSIEPEKTLVYTVFDPMSTIEDIPENYLTVTIILNKEDGKTVLTVTQGDYAKVANGEERYAHSKEGWEPVLKPMKEMLEQK